MPIVSAADASPSDAFGSRSEVFEKYSPNPAIATKIKFTYFH